MGKTRLKPSAEWRKQLLIINNQLQQSLGLKVKLDTEQSCVSFGNKVAERIKASNKTINHIDFIQEESIMWLLFSLSTGTFSTDYDTFQNKTTNQ